MYDEYEIGESAESTRLPQPISRLFLTDYPMPPETIFLTLRAMTTRAPSRHDLPTTTTAACRAVGASKHYGEGTTLVRALDGIDVQFEVGRFSSIMGPSGSGKSTLLHCLAGLDQLSEGEVWVGETNLGGRTEQELTDLRRDQIGFVFQSFNLIPTMTARENITLPIDLAGGTVDDRWFHRVVDAVDLADRLDHRPGELSGGQQQRVAVARALTTKPTIIFADEPTGNLDSKTGRNILTFLRRAVDEFGQTIVMVTHDPVAATYGDRVVFLKDGVIEHDLANPQTDDVLAAMHRLDN